MSTWPDGVTAIHGWNWSASPLGGAWLRGPGPPARAPPVGRLEQHDVRARQRAEPVAAGLVVDSGEVVGVLRRQQLLEPVLRDGAGLDLLSEREEVAEQRAALRVQRRRGDVDGALGVDGRRRQREV